MTELEEVFRAGLAELAEGAGGTAATDATGPLVARARAGAVRRRRTLAAMGAAAAAVVVVAGLGAVLAGQRSGDGEPATPAPTTPGIVAPDLPGGYRPELWHGVSVYVPATWGWGSAPTSVDGGEPVLCGAGVVQADGRRVDSADLPYVGRPVMLSDACDAGWARARPRAPYVWLGADLPAGAVDLGRGWVRETVEVAGSTVTVATDDAALREAILGSAHAVTGGCAARLDDPPTAGGTTAAGFVPVSMTVCAYASDSRRLDYDLLYGQEAGRGAAKALVAAVDAAPQAGEHGCFGASGGEWALLRLRGDDGSFRDYAVDLSCPSIADPRGVQHVLGQETVVPWAVGGVNAVLHASPLVDAPGRLIPPMG